MAGKRYADTVSPRPRVKVNELGVISVAGLMREIIVENAVERSKKNNGGQTDKNERPADHAPNGAAKDLD